MCLLIKEYPQEDLREDHIDIYYQKKTREIQEIIGLLQKHSTKLLGRVEEKEVIFSLQQVYYFESVDKKTYACLEKKVIQVDTRLQDIEAVYRSYGFIRINKSMIVNVYKIASLQPALNMRSLAVLENGERLQINRSYKQSFHAFLQRMQKEGEPYENHS